jgi:hypothetical protein
MDDSLGTQLCLQIPIPQCPRQLPRTPPICIACQGDLETIQILRDFGNERDRYKDEIIQACNLTSGLSDIVVILERPRHINHPCNVSFNEFVKVWPTLKSVDQLIRFASNGTRSIHTVTILNAFSYQPDGGQFALDYRCEQILAKLLQAKKPKVIIHCHNTLYNDPWMRRFNFPKGSYHLKREIVEITHDHRAIVIPSLHPSHAINHVKYKPELQILLMYHFVDAFHALNDNLYTLPCCAERILQLHHVKKIDKLMDEHEPKDWWTAFRVTSVLRSSYHGPRMEASPPLVDLAVEDPEEEGKNQANAFDAMAFWSTLLFKSPKTFNLFGIARVALFLRKMNQMCYPACERLLSLLLRSNMEHEHWFCDNDDSNTVNLSDQFSNLEISELPQIPLILEENKSAYELVSRAISKLGQARGNINWEEHRQYYRTVYDQNQLIREYLGDFQNSLIDKAMRVQALSQRCMIFVNILYKSHQRNAERLTEIQEKGCLSELLDSLVRLKKEFE